MTQENSFKPLEVAVILEVEKQNLKKYLITKNVVFTTKQDLNDLSEIYSEAEKIGLTTPFGIKWTFSESYYNLVDLIKETDFVDKYVNPKSLPEQEINNIQQNYKEKIWITGEINKIYCETWKIPEKKYETA